MSNTDKAKHQASCWQSITVLFTLSGIQSCFLFLKTFPIVWLIPFSGYMLCVSFKGKTGFLFLLFVVCFLLYTLLCCKHKVRICVIFLSLLWHRWIQKSFLMKHFLSDLSYLKCVNLHSPYYSPEIKNVNTIAVRHLISPLIRWQNSWKYRSVIHSRSSSHKQSVCFLWQ